MKSRNPSDALKSLLPSPGLTRRELIHGAAALAASSILTGCGGSSTSSSQIPSSGSNPQPAPAGTLIDASLTVTTTGAGSIGPAFAGLSYEKSQLYGPLFKASNLNLIGLFKRIGPSVLRIGGNSVDKNVWNPTGAGQTAGQIAPSDVDSVAAFVKAAGWQCLYGINLGGSATGATNTTLAAQEVAYAYQQFGSSLLGIEIGNECDLYGGTGNYYAGNWSLSQFLTLWGQYRNAILATTPTVPITGPADASNVSSWTVPFGQAVTKSEITLLTQHYYRANGQSPSSTAAYLITPDSNLLSEFSHAQCRCQGYRHSLPDGRVQLLLQRRLKRRERLLCFVSMGHRLPVQLRTKRSRSESTSMAAEAEAVTRLSPTTLPGTSSKHDLSSTASSFSPSPARVRSIAHSFWWEGSTPPPMPSRHPAA